MTLANDINDTQDTNTEPALPEIEPPNTVSKQIHDTKKLNNIDTAALTLKQLNPGMTRNAIGEALLKAKIIKNPHTIYQRLHRSDYLSAEFAAIENHNREQLVREEFPQARKKLRKFLKCKDDSVPANVQMAAVKLVYDKALADRQDKTPESPVNIGNIERMQVMIQGVLETRDTET